MKRILAVTAVILVVFAVALAQSKEKGQTRTLVGQVMDKSDAPISGAVVHLRNTKTLAERTFITHEDGNYRFNALSPNQDYEVYAASKGKQSGTKTLSQFDSRTEARINLRVE